MTAQEPKPAPATAHDSYSESAAQRDIADVPAIEVVTTVALHLMSAAAVKVGLGAEDPLNSDAGHQPAAQMDLDEARTLIIALAGLITSSAPRLGSFHAAPLRDGLKTLQLAFREASAVPDARGAGPGEDLTGPV